MEKSSDKSYSELSSINVSWLQENRENQKFTSDQIEFFGVCCQEKVLTTAEITSFENHEDSAKQQKFTIYNIYVKTPLHDYYIQKRYSDFHNLLKLIEGSLDKPTVSAFPGKKLWGNFDLAVIESRKQSLNLFLQRCTELYADKQLFDYLNFLDLRKQFLISGFKIHDLTQKKRPLNYNADEQTLMKYLERLNEKSENNIQLFQEIETYFLKGKPQLSPQFKRILLLGSDRKNSQGADYQGQIQGLTQVVGRLEQDTLNSSHLVCISGMKLILTLMDYEQNKDAEVYIQIFAEASVQKIQCLRLNDHIGGKNQKACKHYALLLLNYYIDRNPTIHKDKILSLLHNDLEAYEQYRNWRNMHRAQAKKSQSAERRSSDVRGSMELRERYAIIEAELQKFMNCPIVKDQRFLETIKLFFNKDVMYQQIGQKTDNVSLQHYKGEVFRVKVYLQIDFNRAFTLITDEFQTVDKRIEERAEIPLPPELKGFRRIYQRYLWKDPSTVKRVIYLSDQYIVRLEEEAWIVFISVPDAEKHLKPQDAKNEIGESLVIVRLLDISQCDDKHEDRKTKMSWMTRHLNKTSQSFFLTEMTGESQEVLKNIKKLSDLQ